MADFGKPFKPRFGKCDFDLEPVWHMHDDLG